MSATFQLGKFYEVPAVLVNVWNGFRGWIPVIGPKHEDAEIVGFPYTHFHIDWLFASARTFNNACRSMDQSYVYGSVVQCPDSFGRAVIEEGPTPRRMKYKRELPEYPVNKAKWIPALEKEFSCAKLVAGKCPHRGIPVAAMLREGDVLTCPGHGLRFNAITGELMPRS
jgi:hypothetical protein